ncbi:hypothetical protein KFU94_11235 [Chloroflexi bacterium TSY]|nr:hypothetical protein [Chloroflexi bacterium TSY]
MALALESAGSISGPITGFVQPTTNAHGCAESCAVSGSAAGPETSPSGGWGSYVKTNWQAIDWSQFGLDVGGGSF